MYVITAVGIDRRVEARCAAAVLETTASSTVSSTAPRMNPRTLRLPFRIAVTGNPLNEVQSADQVAGEQLRERPHAERDHQCPAHTLTPVPLPPPCPETSDSSGLPPPPWPLPPPAPPAARPCTGRLTNFAESQPLTPGMPYRMPLITSE